MKTDKLSTHQLKVILRGICNGVALKDKHPEVAKESAAIFCDSHLDIWDICCISSDAEAFDLKASYHYEGNRNRIEFAPVKPIEQDSETTANDNKLIIISETEVIDVHLCPNKTPIVYERKFRELVKYSGMTEEETKSYLQQPIVLELF